MSEPVSNVEIEDVLSSIRRLVSEENRPPVRRESKDSPRKPSRLVLTPSLLVPVPDTDEVPADHVDDIAADAQDEPPLTSESDVDLSDPVEVAEEITVYDAEDTTEIVTEDVGEVEPDQSDPGNDHQDDFVEASDTDSDRLLDLSEFEADSDLVTETETETESEPDDIALLVTDAEPETDATPDTDPAPWRDPETTLYEAAETLPDLAFLPSEKDNDPETDTTAPDDAANEFVAHHEPDVEEIAADATEGQIAPDDDVGPAGADPFNTATLSAKIAVLEAKIGETQDQWEPDGETDDDYAGTPVETIQWQDHTDEDHTDEVFIDEDPADEVSAVEPDVEPDAEPDMEPEFAMTPEPALQPEPTVPVEDALDFLPEDETILDEESLRELVADIVRQELQGALGERITRNVRKLVRREIHRALTAQELD